MSQAQKVREERCKAAWGTGARRGCSSGLHRLDAIAEFVPVLIAGIGQWLIKADVLCGAFAQLVNLSLALWDSQLVPVVLYS